MFLGSWQSKCRSSPLVKVCDHRHSNITELSSSVAVGRAGESCERCTSTNISQIPLQGLYGGILQSVRHILRHSSNRRGKWIILEMSLNRERQYRSEEHTSELQSPCN